MLTVSTASLALIIAGCSMTADPVETEAQPEDAAAPAEENQSEDTQTEASNESDQTLQEVFEKSIEAGESITSLKAVIDMDQVMTSPELPEPMLSTTSSDVEMVLDPIGLYQVMEVTDPSMGTDPITSEQYLTADGFFVYDSQSDQWLKLPTEMSDQIIEMSETQSNPNEQLKGLEQFADDFTFEQDDSSFILTLNASGEKFSEFLMEQAKNNVPELGVGMSADELFEGIQFEDVMYKIVIDKETYLPSALDMDLTMVMSLDGESLEMEQTMTSVYNEYNTIDEIALPEEVKSNAIDMQE